MADLYESISVSERLPKRSGFYWTILQHGTISKNFFDGVMFRVTAGTSVASWVEKVIK